jgi:hypothetical protein
MVVAQGERLLAPARDPAAEDPFFVDEHRTMRRINPPRPEDRGRAAVDARTLLFRNRHHPFRLMTDGNDGTLAIIDPMDGARLDFHIPEARTVRRLGVTTDRRPTRPRDIAFLVDGREILAVRLPNAHRHFAFELDEPVTFSTLRFEVRSIHDGGQRHGGMRRIQAFDEAGNDVLRVIAEGADDAHAVYADAEAFTQPDPDYWKGSLFAIHAGSNFIYYRPVRAYFPGTHTIHTDPIEVTQYPGDRGRFAMLNVLGAIHRPGEFYLCPDVNADGRRRLYVWPFEAGPDGPGDMAVSRRATGFEIRDGAHLEIAGFIIQRQGGPNASGIALSGVNHVTIRGNEIRLGAGEALGVERGSQVRILGNHAHRNRGRGFRLHTVTDSVVDGNRLHRNGRTGIGFYVCRRMAMTRNHVTGHTGVHANSLTVYAGSEDILIAGNRVQQSNRPLTVNQVTNLVIRNNVFDSGLGHQPISFWEEVSGEVLVEHNTLVNSGRASGLYVGGTGDRDGASFADMRMVVRNNLMDGPVQHIMWGANPLWDRRVDRRHNIYLSAPNGFEPGPGERVMDAPETIFVDYANRDYRLRPGSPAIDAGLPAGVEQDIDGTPRPQGRAPDLGAFAFPRGSRR